ncbi:indole-3-acetic acid-induced protein ARG7 [Syzygium oleosum]|uniref:indole-3-acetic acid-induced protein ARG7 n=1 Tax=Syzygium oleosum TaxID=219896 RepID=UPI0024BB9D35|nr:indole-3-acetic acid-induced protein ARG7 [Syzygium oleosum]
MVSTLSSIVKKMWCCGAAATTLDAPGGRVRVRVGRRSDVPCELVVEASHLNHPLFEDLLRSSEEEFGFSYDGALRIACEPDAFRHLLRLLDASRRRSPVHHADLASKSSADDGRSKYFLPPSR